MDDYSAVVRAERELAEAHLSMDLNAIDNLLHPDYIIVQPGGTIENKSEVLASFSSNTRYWHMAQTDQLDIRFYKDTAVVVGRWKAKGKNGEEYFDYTSRFLSIWVKKDRQWKNIAFQSTEIDNLLDKRK